MSKIKKSNYTSYARNFFTNFPDGHELTVEPSKEYVKRKFDKDFRKLPRFKFSEKTK